MQTIIKAKEASDFLALVPQLVGFSPQQSIVLVAFRGNRTCGAMRVDLPRLENSEFHRKTATTLVGMFCKISGVDAVVPVVYSDETFETARGVPHTEFAATLIDRLRFSGFLVRDALCVAGDGWGSYLDDDCPNTGHPLSAISESEVHAAAQSVVQPLLNPEEHAAVPPADLASKERVARMMKTLHELVSSLERAHPRVFDASDAFDVSAFSDLAEFHEFSDFYEFAESAGFSNFSGFSNISNFFDFVDFFDPVLVAEDALEWDAAKLLEIRAARLLFVLQGPPNRDQMMLQFAFGTEVGIQAFELNSRFSDLQRADGRSMDEIVAEQLSQNEPTGELPGADFDIGELMMGQTRVRPDVDRVLKAIQILKSAVALAPRSARPAPLCMLAWLSWTLGRGSVAGLFIDQALGIDAGYGMARLLGTMISSGHLPEWAYSGAAV